MSWDLIEELNDNHIADNESIKLSASAGTGKTTNIIRAIRQTIEAGTPLKRIMFLTFNRKIADEFTEKLFDENLAGSSDDTTYIGTWHSVGKRLAQKASILPHGKIVNLDSEARTGALKEDALFAIAERLGTSDVKSLSVIFNDIAMKTTQGLQLSTKEQRVYQALAEYQRAESKVSFLSMQREMLSRKLFNEDVTHVFVDEAQDMGFGHKLYLDHLKTLPSPPFILIVGDEKQEINGFMGADLRAFTQFDTTYRATLSKTFRLPLSHLSYSNQIFLSSRSSNYVGMTQTTGVNHLGDLYETGFMSSLETIRSSASRGRATLIIARHKSTCGDVREILEIERIPFTDNNVLDVHIDFERERRKCLRLKKITGPMLDLLNPLRGTGETGLLNVRKKKAAIYVDHSRRESFKKEQRELLSAQRSFLFDENELSILEDIAPDDHHRLSLAGLTPKFSEDLFNESINFDFFTGKNDIYYLVREWADTLGDDFEPVKVMTIHKSKGLEADTVVLITDTHSQALKEESSDPESERRVWYVGATRSKHTLILASMPGAQHRTGMLPRL